MQVSPNLHFQVILQVDLRWPLTLICDLWLWRFPYHIKKPSLVQIGLQLSKWGHFHIFSLSYNLTSDDLWPWLMTFDCMKIWRFTYYINKPSLVQIGLQLFKWGHFHIFSLSYNLTSNDILPWYVTFDLINKWGFPCCIYDPTLVEIHQRLWKIEPNVNPFSQQHQKTTTPVHKVILVSFQLRQATQKSPYQSLLFHFVLFHIEAASLFPSAAILWVLPFCLYMGQILHTRLGASLIYAFFNHTSMQWS